MRGLLAVALVVLLVGISQANPTLQSKTPTNVDLYSGGDSKGSGSSETSSSSGDGDSGSSGDSDVKPPPPPPPPKTTPKPTTTKAPPKSSSSSSSSSSEEPPPPPPPPPPTSTTTKAPASSDSSDTSSSSGDGDSGSSGSDGGSSNSGGSISGPDDADPCSKAKCPSPDPLTHTVHLPHPNNCNRFCRCDHGKGKTDICPAGLDFNPKLQVCDWPNVAGCKK